MPSPPSRSSPNAWDQRYREGSDGWELGRPAPALSAFLSEDCLAPSPPGRVLVPGCGRGHEAALLAAGGYDVIGLDFSREALREAERIHGAGAVGSSGGWLRWLQADLFDQPALAAAALLPGSLDGVVEHTCFCAIEPDLRSAYIQVMKLLLAADGWLLGLFWCHRRAGGPPYGSDPAVLAKDWQDAGFAQQLWQPARQTSTGREHQVRQDEWLGFWRR